MKFNHCPLKDGWGSGATTAEKLRGTKVWVPTPGRLRPAPGQRPDWVLDAGGGHPLPLWGFEGITPGKFLKTQMLNPAFWWILAVKFLAFWELWPRSWGTNTLLVPNLKVGDQFPPVPTVVAPMGGSYLKLTYINWEFNSATDQTAISLISSCEAGAMESHNGEQLGVQLPLRHTLHLYIWHQPVTGQWSGHNEIFGSDVVGSFHCSNFNI